MGYRNFEIKTLASGVFAAIASPNGSAGSNSGIIDLGDSTIVFDTMTTPTAAKELLQAAVELTGRVPRYVINSHAHPDHVQGNIIFSESSALIASNTTRREIELRGVESLREITQDFETQIASFSAELKGNAPNEEGHVSNERRAELEEAIQFFRNVSSEFPTPADLRTPTLTYESALDFHGTKRSAYLRTYGGAHSPCDAVLWLPDVDILFVGDLVIPDGSIIMCLGEPNHWLPILSHLEAFGAKTLVPGHGDPMGSDDGFSATRQRLEFMFDLAQQARNSSSPREFVETVAVPEGQSEYWFRKDLRRLVE